MKFARKKYEFAQNQMGSSMSEFLNNSNDYDQEDDGYYDYRDYGRDDNAQENLESCESNLGESTATQEEDSYVYGEKGSINKGWTKS